MTEAAVQRRVKALWRSLGGWVACDSSQGYRPGGRRHATTRITLGFPDLVLMHPGRELVLFREVKRPGGKLTEYQRTWLERARACGADVGVWDSVESACEDLRRYGWEGSA